MGLVRLPLDDKGNPIQVLKAERRWGLGVNSLEDNHS